ncbi:MAG: hypothetical protein F6J90_40385 [Moorea sp. SIOASIH]|nr:hypothetical protein [Moorena sp. SIOASIH]
MRWNRHLAVEWASCRGTGILPWNGHLARFIRLWGGQDAHSTNIQNKTDPTRAGCPL